MPSSTAVGYVDWYFHKRQPQHVVPCPADRRRSFCVKCALCAIFGDQCCRLFLMLVVIRTLSQLVLDYGNAILACLPAGLVNRSVLDGAAASIAGLHHLAHDTCAHFQFSSSITFRHCRRPVICYNINGPCSQFKVEMNQ